MVGYPSFPQLDDVHKAILVWPWRRAPQIYRALSPHAGDEDWVALLPPGIDIPLWMESGTSFGWCESAEIEMPDGWTLVIGAHA